MASSGVAFAAGFARGAAGITELFLKRKFQRDAAAEDEQRQIAREGRAFDITRQLRAEEHTADQADKEADFTRSHVAQFGLAPGATAPLGPGEQGPTPAGPADVATAIKGTPSFQRTVAEQKLQTDENIRQAQATAQAQASQLSVSDRLRLGGDIQKIYADAQDALTKIMATPDGAKFMAQYGGDVNAAVEAMAKPALDQLMALVPPELKPRITGMQGTPVAPVAVMKSNVRDALQNTITDPVQGRALLARLQDHVKQAGEELTPEEVAAYESQIAEVERRAAMRGSVRQYIGPQASARQQTLGVLKAIAPGRRELMVGGAMLSKLREKSQKKPGPVQPAAPRPIHPQEQKLAELKQRETALLNQARSELAMAGAVTPATDQALRRVQLDIAHLGGLPGTVEMVAQ